MKPTFTKLPQNTLALVILALIAIPNMPVALAQPKAKLQTMLVSVTVQKSCSVSWDIDPKAKKLNRLNICDAKQLDREVTVDSAATQVSVSYSVQTSDANTTLSF